MFLNSIEQPSSLEFSRAIKHLIDLNLGPPFQGWIWDIFLEQDGKGIDHLQTLLSEKELFFGFTLSVFGQV